MVDGLLKVKIFDWVFTPTFSITASGFLVSLVFKIINLECFSPRICVTIEIIFMGPLYLIFLLILGYITKGDITWFKNCFNTGIR